ncbi:LysM peptidoglycan-binding domain-containing protein [Knoellia subterranea]|uniref:Lytic transglycosylase n=1 Tax=Knoellia subterranea KCTC 19937 TaxID=1385521 RepID=A0A0A0JR51_9MICO|nr:LysM peptidoglycan-binding domain-containing protein [Knoellia subterranea]KGN38492.1 lytic transglycosylase [Knoellia subterranea KCTC 19937]
MVIALPPATVPPTAVIPTTVSTHASPAPHGWTSYTVKPGDTLIGLAATFRTTPQALAARNGIDDARRLWAGATILVPGHGTSTAKATPRATPRPAAVHTVANGDTLYDLAARFGTTVPALAKANGISPGSFIFPGQRLRLSATASTPAAATPAKAGKAAAPAKTSGTAYTVRSGDTLIGIAAKHGRTVAALVKANGLRGTTIYSGQRLTIPGAAAPKTAPKPALPNTFAGRTYPDRIVQNAARNREILSKRAVPTRAQTKAMIISTARRHGVDPKLALAISMQESGWNQRQVSVANAVGIMQVIPSGGEWASMLIGRKLDLLNAQDNVTAGVVMLRALTRASGSEDIAIAGYYQGLASVRSRGMFTDTKSYVANVKALKGRM